MHLAFLEIMLDIYRFIKVEILRLHNTLLISSYTVYILYVLLVVILITSYHLYSLFIDPFSHYADACKLNYTKARFIFIKQGLIS